MKKLNYVIYTVMLIFLITPIFVKAEMVSPIAKDKDSFFVNWFGKPYYKTDTFIKGLYLFTNKDGEIHSIDNGVVIYRYREDDDLLPSSFGVKDIITIKHNNNIKSYYYYTALTPSLKESYNGSIIGKKQLIGQVTSLRDMKNKNGFLLLMHDKKGFVQPLNFFSSQEIKDYKLEIEKVLLKSGIYQKLISNKVKNMALSLRSSFQIALLTKEKTPLSGFEQLPKKLEVIITSQQTKEVVEHKEIQFTSIINNKVNGILDKKALYHRYWLRDFINLGYWNKKERTHEYLINIYGVGVDNNQIEHQFEVSFR